MAKAPHAQETEAFAQRLQAALAAAGIKPSPTVVAHEFNLRYWGRSISAHTARSWLMGISIPMQDKLQVLAQWLQLAPEDLRFGPAARAAHRVSEAAAGEPLSAQDREMLRRYLALPQDTRRTVRDMVAALHAAAAQPAQAPPAR